MALNELLRRAAGEVHGMPLYKISWAADDNHGLARKHQPGCPKLNPFDWTCQCPLADRNLLPLCFHENQESYHLLTWVPPNAALTAIESQAHADYAKGCYECVMHFIDPETQKPFNPTVTVVELMVPLLQEAKECAVAAMLGVDAVFQRERQKRLDQEEERLKRSAQAYDRFAEGLLKETLPAFGGESHTGYGPKFRQASELTTSDIEPKK